MKSTKLCYLVIITTILSSCHFSCSLGEDKSVKAKTVTSKDNTTLNGAVIKNDIEVEATGVKLKEIYLLDANNNLLGENITRLGDKIYLVIKADTGWVKEKGKSFVGASERISTSGGRVIVDADDVFKDYEASGLSAQDAKFITLSAVITQADPGVDNFVVQFRVWDKKGNGEIKGKYKFRIKN